MLSRTAVVRNKLGFHLYVTSVIAGTARKYQSTLAISKTSRRSNGRSAIDLMLLEAGQGTTLTIEADGEDEQDLMDAIVRLFQTNFGEE